MRALIALGVTAIILGGCVPLYDYIYEKTGIEIPEDNPVEEIAEDVLCDKTGICQDFTPDSPENE